MSEEEILNLIRKHLSVEVAALSDGTVSVALRLDGVMISEDSDAPD